MRSDGGRSRSLTPRLSTGADVVSSAVRAGVRTTYLTFPNDLAKVNGDDSWTLPMPARFVIDTTAVIRYAAVDPDYTRRPEPAETLAALRALR